MYQFTGQGDRSAFSPGSIRHPYLVIDTTHGERIDGKSNPTNHI